MQTLSDDRSVLLAQIGLLVGILGLWEVSVLTGQVSGSRFGAPSAIAGHLWTSLANGELFSNGWVTLYEQFWGFVIGVGAGTAAGLGLWWTPQLARALEPVVAVFNSIPKIALAPPMIVWFGIFEASKIALAASLCVVIAWLAAAEGVRRVDPDQLDMVRAMGGKRRHAFFGVVVPSSMPWIIASLKINIGFALVGVVVGEFVASNHGLGYMAVQASMFFLISKLWMIVFVISAIAAVQYMLVLQLEKRLLHWAL